MTENRGDQEMGGAKLGPDAYKKLYPAEFYKQFIDNGIRPDGRSFGVGRPVTIGLNPIEAPASSALVKIGNTSVLAGCTFEVVPPSGEIIDRGQLEVNVSVTALSLGSTEKRKANEISQVLTLLVQKALDNSEAVDLTKLMSKSKKASLKANLSMHVLDSDGAIQDACLLAAGSSLSNLKSLPLTDAMEKASNDGAVSQEDLQSFRDLEVSSISMDSFVNQEKLPLYHTIGLYKNHLIVDPTSEEEQLMDGCATIALDSQGNLSGLDASKPAFLEGISTKHLVEIVEAAKLRHRDVMKLLAKALEDS